MHDSERIDGTTQSLELAVSAVREQQDKLQALLDTVRSSSLRHLIEQRRIREELAGIVGRMAKLESALVTQRSSDLALEIMALREQQRALQQQDSRLVEQLEALAKQGQRLQLALSESAGIAVMLTTPGTIQDGDGTQGSTSRRVAQAQEEERERLSREVHDGPAQTLANAIFELEFCLRLLERDPVKLRTELVRLKDDLRQALADLRHFMFGLRPSALSELGLLATLRRYAEDYQSRCGIVVRLEAEEPARLTATQEVAIFRIIQESLQNTRKHSKASEVLLRIRHEDDRLEITVEDNGQGFEIDQAHVRSPGHFGLRGMQERALLIGAKLAVTSQPDAGTKVTLSVPQGARDDTR